jgi:hypothetical protein
MYPVLRTLARRVGGVVAECSYTQRRLIARQTSLDSYVLDLHHVPDTCQAFLFWTSGKLAHEPSAAQRSAGEAVR